MSLFELTRKLIDIPSVSGEETEVGRFIASHLEGLGYRAELQEVEPGRANVIATTGARPRVVLSTHLDREGESASRTLALRGDEGVIVELS